MKAATRERIKTGFKVLAVAVAGVWIISFITGYIVEHQSRIHWRDEKGTNRTVGI